MIRVVKRLPIARDAIEARLRALRIQKLHEEITAYARATAGSHADLDPALEAASLEFLARENARLAESSPSPSGRGAG